MPAFRIEVPDQVLADLGERLQRARFTTPSRAGAWAGGVDPDYLRDLVQYWADAFDQQQLSSFLGNRKPDIVLTDVPYGIQTEWVRTSRPLADTPSSENIRCFLTTVSGVVPSDSVIVVASQGRSIRGAGVEALRSFRHGVRAIKIFRAGDIQATTESN
jgi:hypothetical protein